MSQVLDGGSGRGSRYAYLQFIFQEARAMSFQRWLIVGGIIALFVFAKAWVLTHPKSSAGILVGAFLLIISEPATAK